MKLNRINACFLGMILSFGTAANGATQSLSSETKTNVKSIIKNKKFEEIPEITSAELRARAGSRSKYSMKANLSYYGAPVATPFDENLPNPNNNPGVRKTSISGSVSAVYRIDKESTVGFGSGLNLIAPFHGLYRTDVKDPYLDYSRVYFKANSGLMMISSVRGVYVTNPDYLEIGEVAGLSLYQGAKYRMDNGITLSLGLSFSGYYYDRSYDEKDGNASNYYMSLSPEVSYKFTDRLSLKSSLSKGVRNLRERGDWTEWQDLAASGKFGLGISISKDVFVNPYLYFYPEAFTWDTTQLSFSTIFSVF